MNNDMKCPFCKEEIISDLCLMFDKKDKDYINGRQIYKCNKCDWYGNKELWQELIRTRKALYLAIEMLRDIKNDPDTNDELTQEIADRLDEIKTAQEQKDVK